jgi:hypothetical protein
MSRFDDLIAADVPFFLSELGDTITYRPLGNALNDKQISAILVDEKPERYFAPNSATEFEQIRIKISGRANVEGHIAPSIAGFKGQVPDQVLNLLSKTWYVIDLEPDNDRDMHVLVLRDKCLDKNTMYSV